jgi:hypothetical protein
MKTDMIELTYEESLQIDGGRGILGELLKELTLSLIDHWDKFEKGVETGYNVARKQ